MTSPLSTFGNRQGPVEHFKRKIDVLDEDPEGAALEYAKSLLNHSGSSLRFAVRALRYGMAKRIQEDLPALERLYLEELMFSADAVEGIRAFMEKRAPNWRNE